LATKTKKIPPHPAEFSPEVIEVLAQLIRPAESVHDPYGGRGLRLGALCDRLGGIFTATDIEAYDGADSRVALGNAEDPLTYPERPFTIATSPTYVNKRLSDYAKVGPLPSTQLRGRRDYAISLGRPLHPDNTALLTGRHAARDGGGAYYAAHDRAVRHWDNRVIVNVDAPIAEPWCRLLERHDYRITGVLPVHTRRYGGLDNADKRADHEAVIVAVRVPSHIEGGADAAHES
jgi:hypothetical protein